MASEHREKLDDFVNPEKLQGDFSWLVTISDEEMTIAAEAIAHDRAQFVVNAVAAELNQRRDDLCEIRSLLGSRLNLIDADLSLIDASLTNPNHKERELLRKRIEWFEYKGKRGRFINSLVDEEPFVLWLKPTSKDQTPGLIDWVTEYKAEIIDRYGIHASNFTRAAKNLPKAGHPEDWVYRMEDGAAEIIKSDSPASGEIGLRIDDPRKFIKAAFDLPGFGVHSAVALLCIADMQRQQKESQVSTTTMLDE